MKHKNPIEQIPFKHISTMDIILSKRLDADFGLESNKKNNGIIICLLYADRNKTLGQLCLKYFRTGSKQPITQFLNLDLVNNMTTELGPIPYCQNLYDILQKLIKGCFSSFKYHHSDVEKLVIYLHEDLSKKLKKFDLSFPEN